MDIPNTPSSGCHPVRRHYSKNPMFVPPERARTRGANMLADTEIDWTTYMQQIELYRKGERDYKNIVGSTGPLVYPAAHVHIYNLLYMLTGHGTNILAAQFIFAGLYLLTLAVVMQCYRQAKVRASNIQFSFPLTLAGPAICFPTPHSVKALT